ncbi:hypothetical protein GCM10010413_42030 [Promicromonospora sukumoe]|uniref:Uncharacterized protein n=1 Tax=Promicromonospora sukumoe TaxID=88382 RepID=A0A7W3PGS0_9MICO|nr:hypothetical protein [Promicromonospora sukumoe]MBA8811091.1 hypothetical protein [Promicromonospora sukumoe]
MNDTLWGVAIGGAVAIVSALITSVVGPAMTARHHRASSRAERLLSAVAELDDAMERWGEGEEGFKPFSETEMAVTNALRRLANASNSHVLHLAIDKAVDDVDGVGAVIGPSEKRAMLQDAALSSAFDSVYGAARIVADMIDPPVLPVRVVRWVRRRRSLRRWWLAQRRIALSGGA